MPKEAYRDCRDWDAETRADFQIATPHIHVISTEFCNNTSQLWTGREYPLATDDPRQRRDKMLLCSGELGNFGQQTEFEEMEVRKKL
jgi:hypothetical protein